jgi:hypothetical protein
MYDVYTRRRETSLFSFVFSLSLAVLQTAEPKRECREISAMRRVFLLLLASRLLIIFSQSVPKEWARYETTVGAKSATGAVPCQAMCQFAPRCRMDATHPIRILVRYCRTYKAFRKHCVSVRWIRTGTWSFSSDKRFKGQNRIASQTCVGCTTGNLLEESGMI